MFYIEHELDMDLSHRSQVEHKFFTLIESQMPNQCPKQTRGQIWCVHNFLTIVKKVKMI